MSAGIGGAALFGIGEGIFDKVYNYWRDQQADYRADRDFDYQKHLQQEIFDREDNAVQRRMADLQAAGLNPNLAAGSAASAGAVVGRSNTPTTNYGSQGQLGAALDMAQHVAQLRAQRKESKILDNQIRKTNAEAAMAESDRTYNQLANTYDELALLYQLGLTSDTKIQYQNGRWRILAPHYEDGVYAIENTPLQNQLEWQWKNNKNSADLLQKDVDWYTADKVANMIGVGARAAAGFGGAYYNFGRRR